MTEARIPTPRRIALTPVIREPSAASLIGGAMELAGQAGADFVARRQATDERIKEIDHRIALDEQQRQDDALFIEKAPEWALIEEQMRQRAAELRQEGSYRDHPERVRKELDERFRAFDESLAGNERVRQRFRLGIVQSAARIDAQEEDWARQQGFRVQGEALEATASTRSNELTRIDPGKAGERWAELLAERDQLINSGAFNDQQAAVMSRAYTTKLALGLIDGLFNAGRPEMVEQLLTAGQLDGLDLDASKVGDRIAAEKKAIDIAAERAQTEAIEAARAQAEAVEAKVKLGINPTQAEFDAATAAMQAAGVPEAERIAFGGLSVQIGLNRQFSEARDPEGVAAARTAESLRAKIAAGTATEAEQIAAVHLAGVAEARAKAAGAKRKELAGQGVQGQLAVLADLDRLPIDQRFIAANAAKDGLGIYAGLRPRARQVALDGREALKARPDDFGTKENAEAEFRDLASDFAASLGAGYADQMTLARQIYAGNMASRGQSGWDPALFRASVSIAFGRTVRPDGSIQGGIGEVAGHKVILPAYQTADEFERSMRGLTFKTAVYADGRKAVKQDVIGNYRPEYSRDNADGLPMYRMIDARGLPLMKQGGGVYEFFVPRRAAAPGQR